MKMAGFCARCDARYKPGARVCDDCGAPRIIVTTNPVPAEKLSAVGESATETVVRVTAPPDIAGSPQRDAQVSKAPSRSAQWDLLGTRLPAGGSRVTQALCAALAVAGLGLLLLSTQTVSLWTLLGWAPFVQLMAGLAVTIRALLPARSNLLSSAVAGSAGACVVAWQFSAMTTLVPNWVFFISLAAASICVISTILALTRVGSGSPDESESAPVSDPESPSESGPNQGCQSALGSAGPAVAHELLLLTCAVTTAGLLANLCSGEADLMTAATRAATAATAGLGLWVLRTGRRFSMLWLVCGLLLIPGLANWTDVADGTTTALCLITVAVLGLAQPLRATKRWAKRQSGRKRWTPPVGIGPRHNAIAVVISDLLAWLRTGLAAMIAAGYLFWATLLLVVVAALGLAMTPLALLGQVGAYVLETGSTSEDTAPEWLILGLVVAGAALGYVLVCVCAQALICAVAEHDRGGRLRGRELAGRALTTLSKQITTIPRYSAGVLVGALLGLIPGLLLQVRWAFAVPVGASGGWSGSAALKASWQFTRNRFWRTLLAQAIALLVTVAFALVAAATAVLVHAAYGSMLVAGFVAFVPVALGITSASVIMASMYRKFLDAPIRLSD